MHMVSPLDSNTLETPVEAPVRDLRRVHIHPDHWYPLAWSHELKSGKAHGVLVRG